MIDQIQILFIKTVGLSNGFICVLVYYVRDSFQNLLKLDVSVYHTLKICAINHFQFVVVLVITN